MKGSIVFLMIFTLFVINYSGSHGSDLIVSSANEPLVLNPCSEAGDCEGLENAICVNGFCECNGTKFCEDKMETKVTKLGEICQIKADCNIEHSVCEDQKCKCEEGSVGSVDGRNCLKVADGLGGTCEDSIQCYTKVPQSGCQNEKCVCQQKTHEFEGRCFSNIGLGQKCAHFGDCTETLFAKCAEEKCTCKTGYVSNLASDKCLEIAKTINDPCFEDIQCSKKFGKAICKQGFCHCGELYQYKMTRKMCVRELLLGEVCENHTDCHGIEEGNSRLECILGECKCRSGYIEELGFCASSDNRCIDSLCNGFTTERPHCMPGRCECPEERPYCTNQADDRRRTILPRDKAQTNKKQSTVPLKKEFVQTIYGGPLEDDLVDLLHPDEEAESYITAGSHLIMYFLFTLSLCLVALTPNYIRHFFAKYLFPFYAYIIVNCCLWIANLRDAMFTINVVLLLGGCSGSLFYITYLMVQRIMQQANMDDVSDEDDEGVRVAYPVAPVGGRRHHPRMNMRNRGGGRRAGRR